LKYVPTENALREREKERNDPSRLIDYLTTSRETQIKQFFNNDPVINELEKKYGKYLLVPLAVPLFELPDEDHFMHWWKTHSIRPVKQKGDYVADVTGYSPFESVDLIQEIGDDWNLNMQTDNFKKEFPKLWQQFNESLPVSRLLVLNMWSAVQTFSDHRDSAELFDFPGSFRIKLYDENPENSLFVFDNPTKPYHCEEPTFLPNLPTTNTYMWNNLRVKHGSVYDPQYKKILGIGIGLIDPKRYDEVMGRSVELYKDHCLVSKNSLENYVDI
jgi:hypothetical protein